MSVPFTDGGVFKGWWWESIYWAWVNESVSALLTYVEPYLKDHSSLTKFQQLLLILMRLRLSLSWQDLGYKFLIHQSSVSIVFEYVIGVLFSKLKPLIKWPDRDILKKSMPILFRKHDPNCVVIIDCLASLHVPRLILSTSTTTLWNL